MIKKGTIIYCPRKKHKIGVFNTDVLAVAPISVKTVDFEPGQSCVAGEKIQCKLCGSQYIVGNAVFTENGWLPNEPDLEPVTRR